MWFLYILIIAFFLALIGLVLQATIFSIVIGVFIAIFAGIFSAVKSCVLGIHRGISNTFIKVVLYISVGLFVLVILAPLTFLIVMTVLSL